jgi:phosphoglycerate dehydrogenase-like enzyme
MAKTTKKYKIFSTAPPLVLQLIQNFPRKLPRSAELIDGSSLDGKEFDEQLGEADCLLVHYSDPLTSEIMEKGHNLKLIQTPSVGFQHIDMDAATRLKIPVANAAGFNSISVAEHTVMLILATIRKLPNVHSVLAKGGWRLPDQSEMPYELMGKTVGIVGLGRIGREVAKRLKPFDVKLLYYDAIKPSPATEKRLAVKYATLNRLLKSSDIVTLHVPLMKKTEKLISTPQLNIMKPTAVLINTSRGEVIDEPALTKALKEKKIRGAGLDVFCDEPVMDRKLSKKWKENPLLRLDNVVLTPHTASWTSEAILQRLVEVVLENLTRAATGKKPFNIQNNVKYRA